MHGNMRLIVELFNLDMVNGNIVKTCLDELFQELTARNIEVLCSMLDALTTHRVGESRKQRTDVTDPKSDPVPPTIPEKPGNTSARKYQVKGSGQEQKKQYKPKTSIVSLDYLENCL
mmetsp:Transcript_5791/g.7813  ORF Transcript_5791/g.7813 Transcript_5791/m.7813 type:complete len:117 (+) Transcript_5791:1414-1764(+)